MLQVFVCISHFLVAVQAAEEKAALKKSDRAARITE